MNRLGLVVVSCAVSTAFFGCTRMYTLPDAPPKETWVAAKEVKQSPEERMRQFLDAKRAAIQCFAALADQNWTGAFAWMTQDSKAFFENHSDGKGAQNALSEKILIIDGEQVPFDPASDVFIADLADIRDEFANRDDDESRTRKVLYSVSRSGMARPLIMRYEDDRWRVDFTQLSTELLTE